VTGLVRHRAAALALVLGAATLGTGCGDDGGSRDAAGSDSQPAIEGASNVNFPRPSNRSLRVLIGKLNRGPVLAPSVSVLEPGRNRFAFALFDRGNRQIGGLEVALYVARGLDETAHGPFTARYHKIEVKSQFQSRNAAQDPDAARSVYVAEAPFPRVGRYIVTAITKLYGRLVAALPAQVTVGADDRVPAVGDKAIRVHTPTRESVGGDLAKIETRVPPDTMHEVDLADALDAGRPVVLLFATPALCESRVCAPVTDVTEQVKTEFEGQADFIHMEIYNDNDASKGARSQFRAWHLPSEPFLFAIDSEGRVAERLEGAFSADELRDAVRKAIR
jgi:hypothetical protein